MIRLKAIFAGLVLILALCGCGKGITGLLKPNKAPQIEITCGAVRSRPDSLSTISYTATFCWSSYDPDGAIDHFEYCLAPGDTSNPARILATKSNQITLTYKANGTQLHIYDQLNTRTIAFASTQQFLIRSVDNSGAHSPWAIEYFNALSVAPRTTIRVPTSTPGSYGTTGPTITVRWDGTDPDSPDPRKLPVRYHFFFKDISPVPGIYGPPEANNLIRSTLKTGARDSVGADTSTKIYKLLTGHTYCLIIKAEDRAGTLEPYPTEDEGADNEMINYNMLGRNAVFFTASSNITGPSLRVDVASQEKSFSGYDPTNFLIYPAPTNAPISVLWIASAAGYGGEIDNYSYALDIDDPTSDNPKVIRAGGFPWTSPDARSLSAELPGYPTKGTHYFYVRVFDNSGFRTIATVQFDIIPITFSKPLLFIMDSPGISSGVPNTEFLTREELQAYWTDILETDRYYVDISDTLRFPGGRCLPMAGKTDFYIPIAHPLNEGIPLTILGDYRVLVWVCPYSSISGGARVKTALHRMIDPNSGLANNVYTYLQAGGNVWGLGGGFAQQCAIAGGYPEIANSQNNAWKYQTGRTGIGAFAFDFLGSKGGDTLFSSAPPVGVNGEQNPNLNAVLPYPVPFLRETAFGKRLTQIRPITIDLARYDTMLTSPFQGRRDRAPNARPQPGTFELMGRSVFPDGYNPNPELATWQPIAIARTIGKLSEAKVAGVTCAINNAVIGWYKKGTTLAGNGQPVPAPYELYFTGFPAELFNREEVRDLATVVLETKKWNIWRGNCPPTAARLTLERQEELQLNLEKLSLRARKEFEQRNGGRVSVVPTKRRR